MTPRQRLVRLVNWAFGLTLFTLAVAGFGFLTCQPAVATQVGAGVLWEAGQGTRPTSLASAQEWEVWRERQQPVDDATEKMAARTTLATALFVGVPIGVLLITLLIVLSRVSVWLRRGA
jgi:hypothetical protein